MYNTWSEKQGRESVGTCSQVQKELASLMGLWHLSYTSSYIFFHFQHTLALGNSCRYLEHHYLRFLKEIS